MLWQCTTCGACEQACPVGIEHTPVIIGARRGLTSNGEAGEFLAGPFNNLERRGNIWGLLYDQRQKFIQGAGVEIFDQAKHEYLVWLGCAGAFEADFQKSLRALFDILRAKRISFGVLAKERCTGDLAKRSGNELVFQDLATQNIEDFTGRRRDEDHHVLPALPQDDRPRLPQLRLRGGDRALGDARRAVDARRVDAGDGDGHLSRPVLPRALRGHAPGAARPARRVSARRSTEPVRSRDNPFCCGAGGGLLFEEHEAGKRISQERFEQLHATGAPTVVMACPFCSIMLKGAQASSNADVQMTDLMSFVDGKMKAMAAKPGGQAQETATVS